MPHLVVTWDNQLIEKRALSAAVVVGRSSECDIVIRDVHLSRRHCKIDACDGGWCVVDMDSKNGMLVNGQRLTRHPLSEGDVMRMGKEGRLRILFHEAVLPAEDQCLTLASPPRCRPADPGDTMDGTVAGFTLLEPGEGAGVEPMGTFPSPMPQPRTPVAYERDDVARMISALVSSSWDSIYEQVRRKSAPHRPMVRSEMEPTSAVRRQRPETPVDLSLQVERDAESESASVAATMMDGPMRVMAASHVGHPIAIESDQSKHVGEPEPYMPVWIAPAPLPAAVAVAESWQTDSSGALPMDTPATMPADAQAPPANVEATRTVPRPQPRRWSELLADPRALTGIAAGIGLVLVSLSAWHILHRQTIASHVMASGSLVHRMTPIALEQPDLHGHAANTPGEQMPEDVLTAATLTPEQPATQPMAESTTPRDTQATPGILLSNDFQLGLPDPFGPMLNATNHGDALDATDLNVSASILDSEMSPALSVGVNSEPAR